jgi:hypothetical protein
MVVELPAHIDGEDGEMVMVGLEFTVTVTFAVPVHPDVVPVTV